MSRKLWIWFKHVSATFLIIAVGVITIGISEHASLGYGENPASMNWDGEGPWVFFGEDRISVEYIRGNEEDGYSVEREHYPVGSSFPATVTFNLDGSSFELTVAPDVSTPPASYGDGEKILAISDIESNYETLRDFLIAHDVIDEQLDWKFGRGHLVFVGDLVDRGFSTTQVLWFIYRLEQQAAQHGGTVHVIIGNHELKNMHGNFESSSPKYLFVSAILNRRPDDLLGRESFLGRWLESRNAVERINEHLFVHGGIHPDVADLDLDLETVNERIREWYRRAWFPKAGAGADDVLISTKTGPAWYRGYFKDDLTLEQVEKGLTAFGAKAVVVGHTIHHKVGKHHEGRVFAIDVKHPNDYNESFPKKRSEGLLIDDGHYFRLLDDGSQIEL